MERDKRPENWPRPKMTERGISISLPLGRTFAARIEELATERGTAEGAVLEDLFTAYMEGREESIKKMAAFVVGAHEIDDGRRDADRGRLGPFNKG